MDEADRGNDAAELFAENASKVRKPTLLACGACWNCDMVLPEGKLFCDSTCREDYEMIEAAKKRNGKL